MSTTVARVFRAPGSEGNDPRPETPVRSDKRDWDPDFQKDWDFMWGHN